MENKEEYLKDLEERLNRACIEHIFSGGKISRGSFYHNSIRCRCPLGALAISFEDYPGKYKNHTPLVYSMLLNIPRSITNGIVNGFDHNSFTVSDEEQNGFICGGVDYDAVEIGKRMYQKWATK